jgi:hypothetical protein
MYDYIAVTRMAVFHFIDYLRRQKYPRLGKPDEVYDLICSDPRIQSILADMRAAKEKREPHQ